MKIKKLLRGDLLEMSRKVLKNFKWMKILIKKIKRRNCCIPPHIKTSNDISNNFIMTHCTFVDIVCNVLNKFSTTMRFFFLNNRFNFSLKLESSFLIFLSVVFFYFKIKNDFEF